MRCKSYETLPMFQKYSRMDPASLLGCIILLPFLNSNASVGMHVSQLLSGSVDGVRKSARQCVDDALRGESLSEQVCGMRVLSSLAS